MSLAVITVVVGAVLHAWAADMRRKARELRARNQATAEAILAELDERTPVNVRLVRPDGTEVPVELVYAGKVNGLHHWDAVTSVSMETGEWGLRADMIPGKTSVGVVVKRAP